MKKKKQKEDEVYIQMNPFLASIIERTLAEEAEENSQIDTYSNQNAKKRKPKKQNKKKAQKMSRKKQRKTKC